MTWAFSMQFVLSKTNIYFSKMCESELTSTTAQLFLRDAKTNYCWERGDERKITLLRLDVCKFCISSVVSVKTRSWAFHDSRLRHNSLAKEVGTYMTSVLVEPTKISAMESGATDSVNSYSCWAHCSTKNQLMSQSEVHCDCPRRRLVLPCVTPTSVIRMIKVVTLCMIHSSIHVGFSVKWFSKVLFG